MAADEPTTATDSIKRMYQFLLHAEEMRSIPVRTLDNAAGVLWLGDLPDAATDDADDRAHPDLPADTVVSGLLNPEDAATWLRVRRLHRTESPALPMVLRPWVNPAGLNDHRRAQAPGLLTESTVLTREGTVTTALEEDPHHEAVRGAHRDWARAWEEWARRESALAPFVKLYEDAYRIHQEAADLGESYELVLGAGYLTWSAGGQPVRRHLLARRMVSTMDDQGRIEFAPDPDAPGFALEEDMLEAAQRLREEPRAHVHASLAEASEHAGPDGAEALHAALTEWAVAASADARYERSADRQPAAAPHRSPLVTFAPALILRERSKRGQLNALREIVEAVDRGGEAGLLRHIVGEETRRPSVPDGDADESAPPTAPAEDLYFSLPSNAEQRSIGERLRDSDLVVVQGPPGTGKTHTIANLVTDLLARGQRILITSQTARALKVLKDKLPERIQPLAVSRTGDGVDAQRELEGSVQSILERQADDDPARARKEIRSLQERLDRARANRDAALKELRAVKERETYSHPRETGDYEGTLAAIAERLAEREHRHSWIGEVPCDQPPIAGDQVRLLLAAARAYTPDHRSLAAKVPGAAELPDPGRHADALEAVSRAEEAAERASGSWGGDLEGLVLELSRERCAQLRERVDAFTAARDVTARVDPRWHPQRASVLAGRAREARSQADSARAALHRAEEELGQIDGTRVDGLDRFAFPEALRHATALKEGFETGRKLTGPFGMRTRLAKDNASFLQAVTVDGSALDTEAELRIVRHRIDAERFLTDAERALGDTDTGEWREAASRIARAHESLDELDRVLELARARDLLVEATRALPGLASLDWSDDAETDRIAVLLAAVDAEHDAEPARALLQEARAVLNDWVNRPQDCPEALLSARAAVETADADGYAAACVALERVREANRLADAHDRALAAVAEGHRDLAHAVAADPGSPAWEERLARFDEAWAWSVWNRRLAELTDPAAEDMCRARLKEADTEARMVMGKLAAAKAWRACLDRLTLDQEVALRSYQQSVRKIGKGTGKYARVHQRHAQESLRECQPAVPAWIMPLYQVVSTIPMDTPGAFDVVIVDEASQSGPEALLLAWLGRKLVVVGDDKQVSPANVGIDQQQVFTLQERHLGTLPASRRNLFSPNRSLFDIASGLAGSRGQLMLKEHFRCMPEIIGFSNEYFYQGRLQALRQYGTDRLAPLRTFYVADGMLAGRGQKAVNRAEAEQLVEQIVHCCADSAYDDRTMGVVTLQSGSQQTLIEDMLSERLSFEEREERRIRVGTAAAFQGDERDVMFLSAVYAPFDTDGEPRRPGPFSSEAYQQAVNVAASRARDQVWLFHSFVQTDLGETDLRRHYLDYLGRPHQEQDGTGLAEVPADERVEPFDSLFEQRVYRALRERGYRVLPQYPAGGYRIDLVVEGGTRRLAVECDGDAFHTEANAADDAARQRELERVGWTFVRIRGSRFFRDPEQALQPLWKQLEEMGIAPAGP